MEPFICSHGFMLVDRGTLRVSAACGNFGSFTPSKLLDVPLGKLYGQEALESLERAGRFAVRDGEVMIRGSAIALPGSFALRITRRKTHQSAADILPRIDGALIRLHGSEPQVCVQAVNAFREIGGFGRAAFWRADGTRLTFTAEACGENPSVCLRIVRQQFDDALVAALERDDAFTLCPRAKALSGTWTTIDGRIDDFAAGAAAARSFADLAEEHDPHSIAVVPVTMGHRIYGVLIGVSREGFCVPDNVLAACRLFATGFAGVLSRTPKTSAAAAILADVQTLEDPLDVIASNGAASRIRDRQTVRGTTPPAALVDALAAHVAEMHGEDVFACRSLAIEDENLAKEFQWNGGVLIAPLDRQAKEYLAWFRASAPPLGTTVATSCEICPHFEACTSANEHYYTLPWSFDDIELARGIRRRRVALRNEAVELSPRGFGGIDPVTGAATRRTLTDRLQRPGTLMRERVHALVIFDVDRFKSLNDTLGNDGGDHLLATISQRVRGIMRRTDMLARIGGDEFALLYENVRESEAAMLAQRVLDAFVRPFFVEGRLLRVSISAGVAFADAGSMNELMRNADLAMFDAKRHGGNQLSVFSPTTRVEMVERLALEQDLHSALVRKEFFIDLQPITHLSDGSLWGAEALVRWNHPRMGNIPPLQFIKVAEEIGLISGLSEQVVEIAARSLTGWQRDRRVSPRFRLSINFSSRDLMREDSADSILALLKTVGMSPESLCVELTESTILADPERVCATLLRLREAGAEVAVDDFGTGYSSLSFLRTLPISIVKIDQSFVAKILKDEHDLALVRSVLQLARDLDMRVIAEGIESLDVAQRLREMGCDFGQGFYLGQPVNPNEFEKAHLKNAYIG